MFAVPQEIRIITVTKLNRFAKQVLESEIGQVWVSGEISNFTRAASGHWYFTLKDDKAQVRTAMFRGANQSLNFIPKHGDKVVVRANISLYEARGDYQLIAISMEPEGVGQLKLAFEALKVKLQNEGLFAHEAKKTLPEAITTIGVVTSTTGAAVHDILHVLQRRNPSVQVIIYPSMVQGDGAATTIAKQIEKANQRNEVDVLVVGRGGGSLEDLWPFNEEIVARAIFSSTIPVVSAVGHEVDITIADFVADIRAATPSAAAELLSEDQQVLVKSLNVRKQMLMRAINDTFNQKYQQVNGLVQRLHAQHPTKLLNNNQQAFDYLYARLMQQHPAKQIKAQQTLLSNLFSRLQAKHPATIITQHNNQLQKSQERLLLSLRKSLTSAQHLQHSHNKTIDYLSPISRIQTAQKDCSAQSQNLHQAMSQIIKIKQQKLANSSALLNTVSPLATLSRGYSITMHNNALLNSVNNIKVNQTITSKLANGEIVSEVKAIVKDETNT